TVLQGDSMSTIAAQLHICELIYVMLLQANYQKALKTKQRTVNALDMKL
ncbi:MAG: MurR/RpiR family transcriptional regulator, partial [Proteobacteria bacterium]|nr:MurR/RpiR family transcriptional regulator [Candidatus Avisuccinivibrio stercorigallinarum]